MIGHPCDEEEAAAEVEEEEEEGDKSDRAERWSNPVPPPAPRAVTP